MGNGFDFKIWKLDSCSSLINALSCDTRLCTRESKGFEKAYVQMIIVCNFNILFLTISWFYQVIPPCMDHESRPAKHFLQSMMSTYDLSLYLHCWIINETMHQPKNELWNILRLSFNVINSMIIFNSSNCLPSPEQTTPEASCCPQLCSSYPACLQSAIWLSPPLHITASRTICPVPSP